MTVTVLFGEIGARPGGGVEEITPPQNRATTGRAVDRGVSRVRRGSDVVGADRYRHPAPRQGDSRATRRESPRAPDRPALSSESAHHEQQRSSRNAKQPPGAQPREPRGPSPKADRLSLGRGTGPGRSLPIRRPRPNMHVASGNGGAGRTVHHVSACDLDVPVPSRNAHGRSLVSLGQER